MATDSNEWDGVVFAGTKRAHQEFKRTHHIEDTPEEQEQKKEIDKTVTPKTVLSKDTLKPLDEDTLRMLRRTRCANNYNDVYMQSSLEFYDRYYNEVNASPELKAARQIRRMYRYYGDYLKALEIRTAYIDTLVDKYGEDDFMKKLQLGLLQDWIPPMPILSKSAEDYDLYKAGLNPLDVCETLPEDAILEIVGQLQRDFEGVEIDDTCGVETSIGVIKEYGETEEASEKRTNISNLEDLSREFKSWYKAEAKSTGGRVMFKNAPENIRKRFEEERPYMFPGLLSKLCDGGEIEEPTINMNEAVRDEVTGKTMTRGELMKRETIRLLGEAGWSDVKLLKYQEIGSILQRTARKRRARKKRGTDDRELVSFMNAPEGVDPIYMDSEELMSALDSMMRGD